LKPWNILSRNGNGLLGDKIDLPLIQAFQSLMTLLNGSRDRGENQPVRMTDASGHTYVIDFGKPLKLETFDFQEKSTDEGTTFHIQARNLKELRTLLGRIKAKHREFDIDEAVKLATTVRSWPNGMLHGQLQIGPRVVFPALFVSASIFAAYHGQQPHPELREYVACFDSDDPKMPPSTFYFIPPCPWISASGEVTHIVALLASADLQTALVYFELFNAVPVAVLLPYTEQKDVRATYAVDVLAGTEVQVTIDEEAIRGVPWRATHILGDLEPYRFTQERIGRLIRLSQERSWNAEIESLKMRIFGGGENRIQTPRDLINAIDKICDFVILQWSRPNVNLEHMDNDLRLIDNMCSDIEKAIAAQSIQGFYASIAPNRRKLEAVIERKRRETVV